MSKKKKKLDLSGYEDREALCPHFGICGGCTLQKISYDKQLEMKAQEVKTLLEDPPFEGMIPSPSEEGYRNKMEFTFGDVCKGGEFALGLHMRGSFMNIVNITDCHLVHDDINVVRNAVREFFNEYYVNGQITFHNNKSHRGYLRHLLIRRAAATGEILAALVTSSDYPGMRSDLGDKPTGETEDQILGQDEKTDAASLAEGDSVRSGEMSAQAGEGVHTGIAGSGGIETEEELLKKLSELLLSLQLEGHIAGILHIVNDGLSDTVRSDRTDILYGRDYIYDEVLGLRFKISVFSFFQTNTFGAEKLYSKAREYAAEARGLLFDLYSGTGTIAQLMSSAVDNVIGVEIVSEAVDAARENAALNDITNARFIADDVLKALDTLPKPDSIILDPPRDGINPKALGKILSYGVDNIVYVSCKPSSLARDLQSFKLAGYRIEKCCCVDMFPQTANVETVCLLSKLHEAKHHVNVTVDMDELDVTSAESKATYEEIKQYVAEHNDGMKVSSLYIAQLKQKHGITRRENYNKSKSEYAKQPQCPKEKEEAIVEALKHFGMIQ